MSADRPFLLVSGAGLRDWIWDDVRSRLAAPTAVAPRPDETSGSLLGHARRVLDGVPWPEFDLVAHSVGGAVAAALVHLAPERVSGVLGISAVVPAVGRSFLGSLPFPTGLVMRVVVRAVGTRPPESAIRQGLTGRLEPALADAVVRDFRPAPPWLYRDRAPERSWPARRGYVRTTHDRELTPRLQAVSAARLGADWTRTLPTGHLPMLEAPEELGHAISDFGASA